MRLKKFKQNPRTNGDITNNILVLALDKANNAVVLESLVKRQLRQFPLSSHHLVYDDTLKSIAENRGDEIADAVEKACLESDKQKLEDLNRELAGFPGSRSNEFGRYKEVAK